MQINRIRAIIASYAVHAKARRRRRFRMRSADSLFRRRSMALWPVRQAVLRFGVKASIYYGQGDIRVESVPDPEITDPTDALVRITHACICGSDLWFYRGYEPDWKPGFRIGHE